jgi:hypothetical protein
MTIEQAPPAAAADPLTTEFVLEAHVTIGARIGIGTSKHGQRRIVPITGGHFEGPLMHGEVLPGSDWQLVRADGVTELDARYNIRVSDGTLIQVHNRGIVFIPPGARDLSHVYVRTAPEFEAPSDGPHAWLNRSLFVGTLIAATPEFVKVRVYKLL